MGTGIQETKAAARGSGDLPAGGPEAAVPETVIDSERGSGALDLRDLWHHRDLLYFLAWRDIKVRYRQTLLGIAWVVLQPSLMMVVFTYTFGRLFPGNADGLPYPVFVFAGLLPWTFFAAAVGNASASVVNSESLISKIYFPRLIIPLAAVGANLIDFLCAFAVLAGLMLYYGIAPGANLLLVPVLVGLLTFTAVGIGILLAALNVKYRDVRYVVPFFIQVWMFATPTIYLPGSRGTAASLGGFGLTSLNPLTGLIGSFRATVVGGPVPWGDLGLSCAIAAAVFAVGCYYFRRVEDSFVDII